MVLAQVPLVVTTDGLQDASGSPGSDFDVWKWPGSPGAVLELLEVVLEVLELVLELLEVVLELLEVVLEVL